MSRADLATAVGVTWQSVYDWEEKSAMPAYHRLKKVASALKTTVEWLSAGIDVNVPIAAHYTLIPLLGTEREGGRDVQHNTEVGDLEDDHYTYAYRRDFLEKLGVKAESCRVFMLDENDDSMNLGQQLLVDTQQTRIEDRKVYLLDTPAGHQVRRLFVQLDQKVRVQADRRDIPEQIVSPEAVKVIGRVVAFQGRL